MRPTKRQKILLDFIKSFTKKHGYSPSYNEIKEGLDYNSKATIALHINGLVDRGFIRKRFNEARSLEVVDDLHLQSRVQNALESGTPDQINRLADSLDLLGYDNYAKQVRQYSAKRN